jgi:hypothetical protein
MRHARLTSPLPIGLVTPAVILLAYLLSPSTLHRVGHGAYRLSAFIDFH